MIAAQRPPVCDLDRTHIADFTALLRRPPWMIHALCSTEANRDLPWVTEAPLLDPRCAAVCAACTVRGPCLEYALQRPEYGIWAATTKHDRQELLGTVGGDWKARRATAG